MQDELFQEDVDPSALQDNTTPETPGQTSEVEAEVDVRTLLKALNKVLAKEGVVAAVEGNELFLVHESSNPIPATFDVLRNNCSGDGGTYGKHTYYHCTNQAGLVELIESLTNGGNNQ